MQEQPGQRNQLTGFCTEGDLGGGGGQKNAVLWSRFAKQGNHCSWPLHLLFTLSILFHC